jgi:SAM-dependent methyltransferase
MTAAPPEPTVAGSAPSADTSLRHFYENPAIPASSGRARADRQARMLDAVLRAAPGPATIIDVGCGDGLCLERAAAGQQGHHFAGLDWSASSLRQARQRGLRVLRAGIDPPGLPLASGRADVVIMSEIIEHLVDTDWAIEEARRVLRPGGWLLLSTPNLAAWYNRGLLAAGIQPVFSEVSFRAVYGRPGSQVAGHLRLFTRRALVAFLAAYGLDCVKVTGAPYHDVPALLRPLDLAFSHWPAAASILLVQAQKKE